MSTDPVRIKAIASCVAYGGSYLWQMRQRVGSDLVLMPGAMLGLPREDLSVLLTKRADDEIWCLPAGAAEPGGSFARTAIDELAEETGIKVAKRSASNRCGTKGRRGAPRCYRCGRPPGIGVIASIEFMDLDNTDPILAA